MKINLLKSELARSGSNGDGSEYAKVLGCKAVMFPMKYLEVLLGAKFKDKYTWELVIEMFENRLMGWKRNFLSKGGRFTLIKSTMSNLPVYYLSILTIPKDIAKKLDNIQCRFLWGDEDGKGSTIWLIGRRLKNRFIVVFGDKISCQHKFDFSRKMVMEVFE